MNLLEISETSNWSGKKFILAGQCTVCFKNRWCKLRTCVLPHQCFLEKSALMLSYLQNVLTVKRLLCSSINKRKHSFLSLMVYHVHRKLVEHQLDKDSNKIMSLILEVHFVDIAMQLLYQMHNLVALAKEVLRLVDFY